MLTPQEVAQRSFSKASFGGYNMAMVDDFLDEVTADYEALFNENALLKQKVGMLLNKLKEYQSTEEGMRKTLMAAQQTADEMVKQAEAESARILAEAEKSATTMREDIARDLSAETQRLQAAKDSVDAFKKQVMSICQKELEYLHQLDQLAPAIPAAPSVDKTVEDIQAAVERSVAREDEDLQPAPEAAVEPDAAVEPEAAPAGEPTSTYPPVEESSVALYEKLMAERQAAAAAAAAEEDPTAPTRKVERRTLEFGKDFEID